MHTGTHARACTHTHTSILSPSRLCLRLPGWATMRTNLDFTEASDSEWKWDQLGHMQICTSPQTDNHANTPSLNFFTGMPFLPPNQQRQSTEGTSTELNCTSFSFICDKFQSGTKGELGWFNALLTVIAGSSWGHNVLQVLSDKSGLCCWWLHQWSSCTVGYFTTCGPAQAITLSWQGQRYIQHSGTLQLQFFPSNIVIVNSGCNWTSTAAS